MTAIISIKETDSHTHDKEYMIIKMSFLHLIGFLSTVGGSSWCVQIWYASPVSGALYFNLQVDQRIRREMCCAGGVLIKSLLVTFRDTVIYKKGMNRRTLEVLWKGFEVEKGCKL